MSYRYDSEFFDFVNASAGKSASRFIEVVEAAVFGGKRPDSVIDVGCGRGVWAAVWLKHGVPNVLGVDGSYVSPDSLLIPRSCFLAADLSKPFDVGRHFDLVQCLEVAEHIPPGSADSLLDGLTRLGDIVIFSAAIPGQGGEFHVNERPYAYWAGKFAARGYRTYDALRPVLERNSDVEPWYRYNSFVYANDAGSVRLSPEARATLIASGSRITSFAPLSWRARCFVISMLPVPVTHSLARIKHRVANRAGL